jgi:K+ transporter
MATWRARLFTFMQRNSADLSPSFGLPSDRIVEIGMELEI